MKQIPKRKLDALLKVVRKYWETGEQEYITSDHALCFELEKETGVDWCAFTGLASCILSSKGFKPRATNKTVYEVLEVLGYEVVGDGKEHTPE